MSCPGANACIHCGLEISTLEPGEMCALCIGPSRIGEEIAAAVFKQPAGRARVRFAPRKSPAERIVVFDQSEGPLRLLLDISLMGYARLHRVDDQGVTMESRVPFMAFIACTFVELELSWSCDGVKLQVEGFKPDVPAAVGI